MTFASFAHGVLIGYQRIPEVLEPESKVKPEPNASHRFYYDGLLSLLMYPGAQRRNPKMKNFEDFGGHGGFGLKAWIKLRRGYHK